LAGARVEVVESRPGVGLVVLRARVSAICPLTGILDVYDVEASYKPKGGRFVEAYSFARFLDGFQGRKIYQEELTTMIAEAICSSGAAERVRVKLRGVHGSVDLETVTELVCEEGKGAQERHEAG
jgi:7-cyano-7-deazaguanine reductase